MVVLTAAYMPGRLPQQPSPSAAISSSRCRKSVLWLSGWGIFSFSDILIAVLSQWGFSFG